MERNKGVTVAKYGKKSPATIDEYIQSFPKEVQSILNEVRKTIREVAPNASEAIRYAIPTFIQNGNLVHFAAFRQHIGFYALPSGNAKFQKELANYKIGKGSIQFPFDQPIPLDLIRKIVKFRIKETSVKEKKRKRKK